MPEVRLIDANALFNDLKESENAAREWREETQDEEIKIRAEQAYGTFAECALRVKNAPTIPASFRWIPCSERLPKKHETVLTCCYGSDVIIPQEGETWEDAVKRTRRELVTVSIGFIGSDGWYGADGWPNMDAPTFWMPLPDPPEAGADDA